MAKLPDSVSDEVAAALPTAAMTALSMIDSLELAPGSQVLIVGATGGVGAFATQLAAAFREHQPPTLVVWGKGDFIFTVAVTNVGMPGLNEFELQNLAAANCIGLP